MRPYLLLRPLPQKPFFMSVVATIFELSKKPLARDEWTDEYLLQDFFHYQNPWWLAPGCPEPIDDSERADMIDYLKDSLPPGYTLTGEKITLVNPSAYWDETVHRLEGLLEQAKQMKVDGHKYFLGWWKTCVDMQHGILIYMRDTKELMTLNEFLLFMIPHGSTEWKEFYIGSIFDGYD